MRSSFMFSGNAIRKQSMSQQSLLIPNEKIDGTVEQSNLSVNCTETGKYSNSSILSCQEALRIAELPSEQLQSPNFMTSALAWVTGSTAEQAIDESQDLRYEREQLKQNFPFVQKDWMEALKKT